MADIRPFRGVRFSAARFGQEISPLVCPPFDVISATLQGELYERDARNVVRLELPRAAAGEDRYEQAASDYSAWLRDGVLAQDEAPALYLYRCSFSVGGEMQVRHGLIAALHLEDWERRIVLPHERVLPGPIEDRIQLMRACKANFSPIWGLYRNGQEATAAVWASVGEREPDQGATDRDGAEHAVWRCTDPDAVAALSMALSNEPIYVADGHHRYTTALQYRNEMQASSPNAASRFVMAHLVQADDPGLPVTGIHRLVRTGGEIDAKGLRSVLGEAFDLEDHDGGAASLFERLQEIEPRPHGGVASLLQGLQGTEPRPPSFGVYAPRLGISVLARLRHPGAPRAASGDHSEAWGKLDVAALHALGIDRLFAGGTQGLLAGGRLSYAYSMAEVEAAPEAGRGDLAFLIAGTPVDQVLAVADAQDRMPEKSTYFYPKPLTGMVLASLVGDVPRAYID